MTQTNGQTDEPKQTLGPVYANLVDILFAIVLTQGFVFLSSNNGLFSWLSTRDITPFINTFSVYVIVIGSWIRYHAVIQKLGREGDARFVVDILLMLCYYLGFVLVSSSFSISVLFLLILSLYIIWAVLRVKEKSDEKIARWTLGVRINLLFSVLTGFVIATNFIPPYGGDWDSKIRVPLLVAILTISYTGAWFRKARMKVQPVRSN